MSQTPSKVAPLQQLLKQVKLESSNEDLTGLTQADLMALAEGLWNWGSEVAPDTQDARVLRDPVGAKGALQRSVLEAVGPDMPFLVDSLLAECAAEGHEVKALFHPIVTMDDGRVVSVIQIHLPPMTPAEATRLTKSVRITLSDTRQVVSDFEPMKERMRAEIRSIAEQENHASDDRAESIAFLEWLLEDHFVFVGCREYRFETDATGKVLPEEPIMVEGSNLGILRDEQVNVLSRDSEPLILTPEIGDLLAEPFPMFVAKSTLVSRVHRRVKCDYIGVKKYDAEGRVNGEVRFVGLFTAEAYDETARSIPFVRRRVKKVIEASGATPGGHTEKTIANLLETWPRDELFQTHSRTLTPMIVGAMHLVGRPRTRLFLRADQFDRFVTAIVFVPREAYDTNLRIRIADVLTRAYDGTLEKFQPYFDTGPLARVHFEISLDRDHPEPDAAELEREIAALARTWDQGFREAIMASPLADADRDGGRAFLGAFNAAYREAFPPAEALRDVVAMAGLHAATPVLARAFRLEGDGEDAVRVKIYARKGAIPLSRCVPVFENMGLFVNFETGYPVRPSEKPAADAPDTYWIHSLFMQSVNGDTVDLQALARGFEDAFVAVWSGLAENDGFNRLVLCASASWREAALMRALSAYRRQSGLDQPQDVQEDALAAHPKIVRLLLDLFAARFDPASYEGLDARRAATAEIRSAIETALADVATLTDDQILRHLTDLIFALQRTNFYQTDADGRPLSFISFKVASRELEDLPDPKPYREIFMSSPQVDGVHLRFGPVARGGLRWSDRAADYRTEVLGLVKAQQVKNAVIVPVGSKGGFFPKQLADRSDRNAWFESGRDAYKQFITALLELTDNLDGANVLHPQNTVIWDGEDPYLVVAADKGTATFSDTANAISEAHGFWLGDAFASGGSVGYDHKKMGITARGAWEAVKRHFREMGKDIQTEPFTVIGVGDMSGDVFGNGMLLSSEIRLMAAFNHLHIFVDPNPGDSATNLAERQRLFDMQGSSWSDYNTSLISKGGGIFPRTAKSIPLSDEMKAMTGVNKDAVTPDELIHALLKTETDLLWFGGIGTYVKASSETHAEAGDRSSDAFRVNGRDLKAKVIGEGANLGLTQAGRIEFAQNGGRINTDAIDNSAGVDSSDHEVNIKILAAEAIRIKSLKAKDRNGLLAEMTDDVAAHVLRHNYDQTAALSLAEASAAADHEALERLMVYLEERGVLNRPLEGLPSSAQMRVRQEQGQFLTRPELAVLLAWSKIVLIDDVVASDIPDDPYFESVLTSYFTHPIDTYGEAISNHRLKREIIATVIANRSLDMAGPVPLLRLREMSGGDSAATVRGLEAARAVLDFDAFRREVDSLDNSVPAGLQIDLRTQAMQAMNEAATWFVRMRPGLSVGEAVAESHVPLNELKAALASVHSPYPASRIERATRAFMKRGAPEALARWAAAMSNFAQGLVVTDLAKTASIDVEKAASAFYAIGDSLRLDRLRDSALEGLEKAGYWDRVAGRRLVSELVRLQATAASDAIGAGGIDAWLADKLEARRQLIATLGTLSKGKDWSFAKFTLSTDAVRQFMGR